MSAARKAAGARRSRRSTSRRRARSRGGRCSTCASMRSTRRCGKPTSPASSARGPTASCCPRPAPARTCTGCRSRCIMPRSAPGIDGSDAASSPSSPRCRSRCCKLDTYVGASARLEGLTWGAEDLVRRGRRADQPRGGWQLDLALSAGARSVPVHGRGRRRAADRHRVRRFPRRAGLAPGGAARPPATASRARWPSTPTRWPPSTRSSRRAPRRSPRAQAIVKAFADNPRRRRPGHRRPDGRQRAREWRRAHPGARQGVSDLRVRYRSADLSEDAGDGVRPGGSDAHPTPPP